MRLGSLRPTGRHSTRTGTRPPHPPIPAPCPYRTLGYKSLSITGVGCKYALSALVSLGRIVTLVCILQYNYREAARGIMIRTSKRALPDHTNTHAYCYFASTAYRAHSKREANL